MATPLRDEALVPSLHFFKTLLDVEVSTSTNCEVSLKKVHLGDSTFDIATRYALYLSILIADF
jgi:hypothetical protein